MTAVADTMTHSETGASTQPASGPLTGVRIVEFAGIGPGPFACMLLADMGAEVVTLDRVGANRLMKGVSTRGRAIVELDLKDKATIAQVLDLLAGADALIEGFRPGVMERLGLGPDIVFARNAKLVYGRMTGWGQEGPLAQTAGHDIAYIAVTGDLHAIGRSGGPPQVPLNLVGDFGGGSLYLAVGVLAALREVERSGRGQVVDAAIVDGAAHLATIVHGMLAGGSWQDRRGANLLDTGTPFYDVYETSDGGHMAVGPLEGKFFGELVRLLGIADDAPGQLDVARWP